MAASAQERSRGTGLDLGRTASQTPDDGETKTTKRGAVFLENGKIMVDTTQVNGSVLRWLLLAGAGIAAGGVIIDGLSKLAR
jgi:hypothetical protein